MRYQLLFYHIHALQRTGLIEKAWLESSSQWLISNCELLSHQGHLRLYFSNPLLHGFLALFLDSVIDRTKHSLDSCALLWTLACFSFFSPPIPLGNTVRFNAPFLLLMTLYHLLYGNALYGCTGEVQTSYTIAATCWTGTPSMNLSWFMMAGSMLFASRELFYYYIMNGIVFSKYAV